MSRPTNKKRLTPPDLILDVLDELGEFGFGFDVFVPSEAHFGQVVLVLEADGGTRHEDPGRVVLVAQQPEEGRTRWDGWESGLRGQQKPLHLLRKPLRLLQIQQVRGAGQHHALGVRQALGQLLAYFENARHVSAAHQHQRGGLHLAQALAWGWRVGEF